MKLWLAITFLSCFGTITGTLEDEKQDDKHDETEEREPKKYSPMFLKGDEPFLTDTITNTAKTERSIKFSVEVHQEIQSDSTTMENLKENNTNNITEKFRNNDDESTTEQTDFVETVTQQINNYNNLNSSAHFKNSFEPFEVKNEPITNETQKTVDENSMTNVPNYFIQLNETPKNIRTSEENRTEENKNNKKLPNSSVDLVYSTPYEENKDLIISENVTIVYPDKNSRYLLETENHNSSNNNNHEKFNTSQENNSTENISTTEKPKRERICIKTKRKRIRNRQEVNKEVLKEDNKEDTDDDKTEMIFTTERTQNQVRHYLYRRKPIMPFILKGKTTKNNERLNDDEMITPDLIPDGTENLQMISETDKTRSNTEPKKGNTMNENVHRMRIPLKSTTESYKNVKNQDDDIGQKTEIKKNRVTNNHEFLKNESTFMILNRLRQNPRRSILKFRNTEEKYNDNSLNQTNGYVLNQSNIRLLNSTIGHHENIYTTIQPFKPSPEYNPTDIIQNFNQLQQPKTSPKLQEGQNVINNENFNDKYYSNNITNQLARMVVNNNNILMMLNNLRKLTEHQQVNIRKNINDHQNITSINQNHYYTTHANSNKKGNENYNHDDFYLANYESKKITPKFRTNQTEVGKLTDMMILTPKNTTMKNSTRSNIARPQLLRYRSRFMASKINPTDNQELKQNIITIKTNRRKPSINNYDKNNVNKDLTMVEKLVKENLLMEFEKIKTEMTNRNQQKPSTTKFMNRLRNQRVNGELPLQKIHPNHEQINSVVYTDTQNSYNSSTTNSMENNRSRYFRGRRPNSYKYNNENYNMNLNLNPHENSPEAKNNTNRNNSYNKIYQTRFNFRNRQTNYLTKKENYNETKNIESVKVIKILGDTKNSLHKTADLKENHNSEMDSSLINNENESVNSEANKNGYEKISVLRQSMKARNNDSNKNKKTDIEKSTTSFNDSNKVTDLQDAGSEKQELSTYSGKFTPPNKLEDGFIPMVIEPQEINVIGPIPSGFRYSTPNKTEDGVPVSQLVLPDSPAQTYNVEYVTNTYGNREFVTSTYGNKEYVTNTREQINNHQAYGRNLDSDDQNTNNTIVNNDNNKNHTNCLKNDRKTQYDAALKQYNEALKIYNAYLEKVLQRRQ